MADTAKVPENVDEYIAQFDGIAKERLLQMREIIRAEAGDAKEKISWAMPTFTLYGNLVHYAAFKNHTGLFPGVEGVERFLPKLEEFHTSKGGIQFPYAKPLPEKVIREIVRFRVAENTKAEQEKKAAKEAAKAAKAAGGKTAPKAKKGE